jgi:hypothetical protein
VSSSPAWAAADSGPTTPSRGSDRNPRHSASSGRELHRADARIAAAPGEGHLGATFTDPVVVGSGGSDTIGGAGGESESMAIPIGSPALSVSAKISISLHVGHRHSTVSKR